MSAAPRELRILDGLHAGARAVLAPRMTIGSALDNDIVLSDPGIAERHAELHWDAANDCWQLQPLHGEAPAAPQPLALGQTIRLGSVRLTVASANEPFAVVHEPVSEAAAGAAPSAEDVATVNTAARAASMPEATGAAEQKPAPGPSAASPDQPPAGPSAASRWPMHLAFALGTLLLLLLAGGAIFIASQTPGAPVAPLLEPEVTATRPRVQELLRRQGLAARVTVTADPARAGALRLTGLTPDDEALENLAAALGHLQPRPSLRVQSLPGLRVAMREAGVALPAGHTVALAPSGELLLGGPELTAASAQALQSALKPLLPPGVDVVSEIERPDLLLQRFVAAARSQGFDLAGDLVDGKAQLELQVASADVARWEDWLATHSSLALRHLRFAVRLHRPGSETPQAPPAEASAAAARRRARAHPPAAIAPEHPPWRIRSVVGGPLAHVVLDDGARLYPGARHEGWQLVDVRDRELVVEHDGRPHHLPR